MVKTNIIPFKNFQVLKIRAIINDKEKIEKIILKLKKMDGVKEVGYKLII